jgi:hypothetical protein
MAYNHKALRETVRNTIYAVLPELSIILEAQQGERRNYAGIAVPFCVVLRGRAAPADWGIANLAYERPFLILLVYAWDDNDVDLLEQKLELVKSALFVADYTASGATLLSDPEIDTTPENPANQIILSKNLQIMGGTLTLNYVCGESATVAV